MVNFVIFTKMFFAGGKVFFPGILPGFGVIFYHSILILGHAL